MAHHFREDLRELYFFQVGEVSIETISLLILCETSEFSHRGIPKALPSAKLTFTENDGKEVANTYSLAESRI